MATKAATNALAHREPHVRAQHSSHPGTTGTNNTKEGEAAQTSVATLVASRRTMVDVWKELILGM